MKKYLIVLATALVALAGCKGGGESSKYTSIRFKDTAINLAVGETKKLNVLYEPTTLEPPTCEWSSSNEAVATVDNGTVTAVAAGTAQITAKNGDLTAVCEVTVKSAYAMYDIEDYGVFGKKPSVWVTGTDTTFNLSWAGGAVHCRMGLWTVLAWDGDLTYVSGEGLQGVGLLLYSHVPFYTVDDEKAGENNGTPFGWGSFALKDLKGDTLRNIGQAGTLNEAIFCEYMDSYITEIVNDGDGSNIKWDLLPEAIDGAIIFRADYTGSEPSWSYTDNGLIYSIVKDMELYWNADAETFSWVADIAWFNNLENDRYFGLKCTIENEEITGVVKPYDLSVLTEHYQVGDLPTAGVQSNEPKAVKVYKEMPEIRMGRKVVNNVLIKK